MAYINAEDVKAIRKELKEAFPKFKFGVRKTSSGMRVDVTIKQGPTDFSDIFRDDRYAQINPYHTGMYGEHSNFFEQVLDIMKTAPMRGNGYNKDTGWYDRSDAMTDYFDTAYYMSLNVGEWDKPYACSK